MSVRSTRLFVAVLAAVLAGSIAIADAKPRFGGMRGDRTPNAPAATQTAPRTVQPGPTVQPGAPTNPSAAARPGAAPSAAPSFGRALMTGLVFGGLFALIAGGALGGLAGTLALLLQVLAIGLVVWLVLAFFRSRRSAEPALAGAGQAMARAPLQQVPAASVTPVVNPHVSDLAPSDDVGIKGEDFNAFERMLGEVLTTYGAGDRVKLATLAAPDMAQSLNENLDENAKKDLVNHITNVKLLQGDLSEAWREGEVEYATVAMRYQLADGMFSTESGRWISGSKSETDLQQVVEHWTFVRKAGAKPGEGWKLTMIGEA